MVGANANPNFELMVRKNGGTIGTTPPTAFSVIFDSNESQNGMLINSTEDGFIRFGDASSSSVGGLYYDHVTDTLRMRTAGLDTFTMTSTSFILGDSLDSVRINHANNEKIQLIENNTTGRPYMSFFNKNTSGTTQRKGYVGNPENSNNSSSITLASEYGDVKLIASASSGSSTFTAGENGVFTVVRTGCVASCSQVVGASSVVDITWTSPTNYNGTFLSSPSDSSPTAVYSGLYSISVYGDTGGSGGLYGLLGSVNVPGGLFLYNGSYQDAGTEVYTGAVWQESLNIVRWFNAGDAFNIRIVNRNPSARTYNGILNIRLIVGSS
jgi:hypothetical protein